MSQDAAFYLDPLRDIYEVLPAQADDQVIRLTVALGIHHIHISPTSHQLSWRRAFSHHHDARKAAYSSPLAPHSLSCEGGHLRSSHVFSNQARHFTVRLAEAYIRVGDNSHESYRYIPGGLHRTDFRVSMEWHTVQRFCHLKLVLTRNVLDLHVAGPATI